MKLFKKKLNAITPMPTRTIVVWWICRGALLLWGLNGLFRGYTSEFVQSIFAIAFTHLWDLFQLLGGKSFITLMPTQFQTDLNVFICIGVCVGSTLNNRTDFAYSDIFTHAVAGFIASGWCSQLLELMPYKKKAVLAPSIAAMAGFGVALAMLDGWEIYEFTMDRLYGFSLQMSTPFSESGLIDTMTDFIIGAVGGLAGMFYYAAQGVRRRKNERKADDYE